jgi:hypothetical protein
LKEEAPGSVKRKSFYSLICEPEDNIINNYNNILDWVEYQPPCSIGITI